MRLRKQGASMADPKPLRSYEVPRERTSGLINPYAGFTFEPGIIPEPEGSSVMGAAWRNNASGLLTELISKTFKPIVPDPNYNVYPDIPDRHLNEHDIQNYLASMSTAESGSITTGLDREKKDTKTRIEHPIKYLGASIVADPLMLLWPIGKGGQTLKSVYQAAVAAKTPAAKLVAGAAGRGALELGLIAGTQAAVTETLAQQVLLSKSTAESVMDVAASALLGSVLGGVGGGIASSLGVRNAKSHIVNAMADIPDVPSYAPNSKLFLMGPIETVVSDSNEKIAAIPKWLRNSMKFSDMNQLMESPYQASNYTANLLYSHPFVVSKNITENLPTPKSLDDLIFAKHRQGQKALIEFDRIFREQLGVSSDAFSGIRARIAEGGLFGKPGLNRNEFHEAVGIALDTNVPNADPSVMRAVEVIRNQITQPRKVEAVEQKLMHPKFLEPEHDAYFHRMWNRNEIGRRPQDFEKLTRDFYKESDNFYRNNAEKIAELNALPTKTRSEIGKKTKALNDYLDSDAYKSFQDNKTKKLGEVKSKKDEVRENIRLFKKHKKEAIKAKDSTKVEALQKKIEELEKKINTLEAKRKEIKAGIPELVSNLRRELDTLKDRLVPELDALYGFIPKIYLPYDGHIPSLKTDLELGGAANQTLMRLLGTDIESQMNPFVSGRGLEDPLQARVFNMPNNYSTRVIDPDGTVRTVVASDFVEKDIHRVMSNYIRKMDSKIETTKLAREFGFSDGGELKVALLAQLEGNYKFAIKGKGQKESKKFTKQFQADQKRINRSFDTLNNITGVDVNAYGPGFEKLLRHLREWTKVRQLGSASASSITEIMQPAFRQGFEYFIRADLIPLLQRVVTFQQNKAVRMSKAEAREAGFANNVELGKRAKAFIDNDELFIPKAWWGKIAEPIVNTFGNVTLQNHLTDYVQNTAWTMTTSRTIRVLAKKFEKGKFTERERIRFRALGIPEEHEKVIYEMWRESVGPKGGTEAGVYYSNMGKWNLNSEERVAAFQSMRNSQIKDVRQSQTTATAGDKLPGHSHPAMRTILLFKDYLFGSNNKVLLAGVQKLGLREYDVFITSMMMISMGSLSYVMNSLAKDPTGKELDLSAGNLFREGLDRSALLAIWGEPINILSKAQWFPIGEPSRYKSRGIVGSLAGPVAGVADDVLEAGSRLLQSVYGKRQFTTNDVKNILRLLPYQNLFYLRYINEQVAKNFAVSLGAKRV